MANGIGLSRDVAVIIPAAGTGSRIGGVPKQFRKLGNKTLLRRAIECFTAMQEIMLIVVVVPESAVSDAQTDLDSVDFDRVVVASGGATRQESVRRGLERVADAARVVLVHDAARPFVSADEIRAVIAGVRDHGGAALAVPVTDTLRRVSGTNFAKTVSRQDVYRMQTPQGFLPAILLEAHREAAEKNWESTDDVDLVLRSGQSVRVIDGRSSNFKITTPEDWEVAEIMVRDAVSSGGSHG